MFNSIHTTNQSRSTTYLAFNFVFSQFMSRLFGILILIFLIVLQFVYLGFFLLFFFFLINLFFIGVQFTNIQINTQCSSRQVPPSAHHAFTPTPRPPPIPPPLVRFPELGVFHVLSPFLIFPTHFFSLPLYSLSLLFIFHK